MGSKDELDDLLDAYDANVETEKRRTAEQADAHASWVQEFSVWAHEVARPAMEEFVPRMNDRGHDARAVALPGTYEGAGPEAISVEFLVQFREGGSALFRVRRESAPEKVAIERSVGGSREWAKDQPFDGATADWVRDEVRDLLRDALSGGRRS